VAAVGPCLLDAASSWTSSTQSMRCRSGNPLCVVLPCHRVVASSGALTAYSGGLAAKEYLLALESRP